MAHIRREQAAPNPQDNGAQGRREPDATARREPRTPARRQQTTPTYREPGPAARHEARTPARREATTPAYHEAGAPAHREPKAPARGEHQARDRQEHEHQGRVRARQEQALAVQKAHPGQAQPAQDAHLEQGQTMREAPPEQKVRGRQEGRAPTRQEQKAQTRQALLDTALRLLEDRSLDSLGLREITREVGIVPTAFYRHFPDVPSLGVALVEQCLGGLRAAVRSVRDGMADSDAVIGRSLEALLSQLHARREHFRFIARERHGGVAAVRRAIREQLDLSAAELATDLLTHRLPHAARLDRWQPEDLRMLAELIVNHMVLTAATLLEVPAGDQAAEADVLDLAERQLRLIALGSRHWPGP